MEGYRNLREEPCMKGRSECDALSLSWKKEIGLTRAKFVGEAISNGLSMRVWLEKKKIW